MDPYADDVFDALADNHRRRLLFALLETNSLNGTTGYLDSPPDGRRFEERTRSRQQHVHLPKLDDYGFIEWAPVDNDVRRGSRFSEIRPVLELLYDHQQDLVRP